MARASRKTATVEYVLPDGEDWAEGPVCLGGSPANPTLTDIQRQIDERQAASRESREERVLAIRCGFCQGFHKDAQLPQSDIIGGDLGPNVNPVPDPEGSSMLVELAAEAVVNGNVLLEEEDGEIDPDIEALINDDTTGQNSAS